MRLLAVTNSTPFVTRRLSSFLVAAVFSSQSYGFSSFTGIASSPSKINANKSIITTNTMATSTKNKLQNVVARQDYYLDSSDDDSAAVVAAAKAEAPATSNNNNNEATTETGAATLFRTETGSKDFLLSHPSGAYTTARTSAKGSRIFEWDAHVKRTAASVASIIRLQRQQKQAENVAEQESAASTTSTTDDDQEALLSALSDPSILRSRMGTAVAAAVHAYREINNANNDKDDDIDNNKCDNNRSNGSGELKITVLVEWGTQRNGEQKKNSVAAACSCSSSSSLKDSFSFARVWCHVTTLPELPVRPVRVEVRGVAPRGGGGGGRGGNNNNNHSAAVKNSAWVRSRGPLEALMASAEANGVGGPMNELLLTTTMNGNDEKDNDVVIILEGSQSNFYAILNGQLHTAGAEDGRILAGTVRTLVLDVCRREGIPVVFRPPRLSEQGLWEGALLSSTSRLALPIGELYVPPEGRSSDPTHLMRTFPDNDNNNLAVRIQTLVAAEVEARSTPILDVDVLPFSRSSRELVCK